MTTDQSREAFEAWLKERELEFSSSDLNPLDIWQAAEAATLEKMRRLWSDLCLVTSDCPYCESEWPEHALDDCPYKAFGLALKAPAAKEASGQQPTRAEVPPCPDKHHGVGGECWTCGKVDGAPAEKPSASVLAELSDKLDDMASVMDKLATKRATLAEAVGWLYADIGIARAALQQLSVGRKEG